nr:hypothetical protein [Tanacetum cinerariifolium]
MSYALGMEHHYMVFHLVNGVRASGVEMICEMDFVRNSRNSCVYDPNPNSFDCPRDSYHPPHPTYETYSGDSCRNDSQIGYDCLTQLPLNYEPEPNYIQNINSYPHDSLSFPQQYLCCDNYGSLHETFQGQPMNQNFYNSNSSSFDQTQPPQFLVIYQPPQEASIEMLHDQENAINFVQTFLRKFNRYSFFETPKVLLLAWDRVFKIKDALGNKQYKSNNAQELFCELFNDVQNIHEELAEYINFLSWNCPAFYDDDDDDDVDYTIAITPILPTEEPDNSLSMGDEHLDTIPATESDKVLKSSVENLIPIPSESEGIPEHMCDVPFHDNSSPLDISKDQFEDFSESNDEFSSTNDDSFSIDNIDYVEASPLDSELVSSEVIKIVILEVGWIDDDILLTIKDDILHEKLLNVNLLIAKIEALNDNPIPSSDCKTKSPSTSLNSLLEETNTSDNSLPKFENFCFDVEEISSGSTTTHSDNSLPEYEVFHDDHVKEISSGSPTTHSDSSFYASFLFDLSINPFPPADRSDFYEFTDELIPFISPPEYDCFLFKVEPNSRGFTKDVVEDISTTKKPQVHNALPTHPNLQLNMKFQPSSEYLFTYVVWILLPFLVYSVAPYYLLSLRNEDTIFDPGICNSYFSRPDISHRCGTFPRFKVLPESPMEIFSSTCSPMDK